MKLDRIKKLLPGVFERAVIGGTPLQSLLEVMEMHHQPSEEILRDLPRYFNPRETNDAMAIFLSRWVNLEWLVSGGSDVRKKEWSADDLRSVAMGRLRELISNSVHLSKWRGTARGLRLFLTMATGVEDVKIIEQVQNEEKKILPFHMIIEIPKTAKEYEATVVLIVEKEKPAYSTYEIRYA